MNDEFDALLQENLVPLLRYVNYKVNNRQDAEDIVQEVCLTATQKFDTLKNISSFKAWIIGIANHKINDYYRKKTRVSQIPLDAIPQLFLGANRFGITKHNLVRDTMDNLSDNERQILYMYYFKELSQEDISNILSVPLGTVKSRLHYAKQRFKQHYPNRIIQKGDTNMIKIPEKLPEYKIEKSNLAPFTVINEELQGWPIIPRLNESSTWGLYDMPSRKRTEYTKMKVVGKAQIHGIEGVEISAIQYDAEDYYRTGSINEIERRFVAQLTDTHCRYLAESHEENGVRKLYTFLDGDCFINNWGFGDDNCGKEINLTAKGLIKRDGNTVECASDKEIVDVVGRYTVTIGNKVYDTICVMDVQCFNDAVVSEEYIDQNGRCVLWRRFNKNDWAFDRYKKLWTEILPKNKTITVNGQTFVHWYDCVTDYIF